MHIISPRMHPKRALSLKYTVEDDQEVGTMTDLSLHGIQVVFINGPSETKVSDFQCEVSHDQDVPCCQVTMDNLKPSPIFIYSCKG